MSEYVLTDSEKEQFKSFIQNNSPRFFKKVNEDVKPFAGNLASIKANKESLENIYDITNTLFDEYNKDKSHFPVITEDHKEALLNLLNIEDLKNATKGLTELIIVDKALCFMHVEENFERHPFTPGSIIITDDKTGKTFIPQNLQEMISHEINDCYRADTSIDPELEAYQAELIQRAVELDNSVKTDL